MEGRRRERERKKNTDWLTPAHALTRAREETATEVRALDWESNLQRFDLWADVLTIEQPSQGFS